MGNVYLLDAIVAILVVRELWIINAMSCCTFYVVMKWARNWNYSVYFFDYSGFKTHPALTLHTFEPNELFTLLFDSSEAGCTR